VNSNVSEERTASILRIGMILKREVYVLPPSWKTIPPPWEKFVAVPMATHPFMQAVQQFGALQYSVKRSENTTNACTCSQRNIPGSKYIKTGQ
jgi:hypothetical protein